MRSNAEGNDEAFDFEEWVATVRDPATQANEGRRTFKAGKHAEASYDIAPLPDGRWAVRVLYAFHCGNSSTSSSPWVAFDTREDCLAYFLDGALHHFEDRRHITSSVQEKAREKMAALFGPALVFVEPKVEPPDPEKGRRKEAAAVRLERQKADTKEKLKQQYPLFADVIDEEE